MHAIWLVPELVITISRYLDDTDLIQCFNISKTWRQILQANLPASQQPLPDYYFDKKVAQDAIASAQHIRDYAAGIDERAKEQWAPFFTDMWVYESLADVPSKWQDQTFEKLLHMMKPYLHPFLAKHAKRLRWGTTWSELDDDIEQEPEVRIWTQCSWARYEELLDSSQMIRAAPLTGLYAPRVSIEVMLYSGHVGRYVYQKVEFDDPDPPIMIESHRGVRMGDVIDELRGELMQPIGGAGNIEGECRLEWRLREKDWGS